jgi:small subunit ribosomal protein S20e
MSKVEKDHGEAPKAHRIRITLTSRKVASLEKVSSELIERARSKGLTVKGPVRLPTKNLKITTRKTPCGEGSKTCMSRTGKSCCWKMHHLRGIGR